MRELLEALFYGYGGHWAALDHRYLLNAHLFPCSCSGVNPAIPDRHRHRLPGSRTGRAVTPPIAPSSDHHSTGIKAK